MTDKPVPDTSCWQPKLSKSKTLERAFYLRCLHLEKVTLLRAESEKNLNIHNFDSGPGVEDLVRDGIRQLLPTRYAVDAGLISDRGGYSSGDCDIVIYNGTWFPVVKDGATSESRRKIFPIEGVYSVLEVKQSLSLESLDAAMEKLVTSHRLFRPDVSRGRIVENRESGRCLHHVSNSLHTGVIATGLASGFTIDEAIERFIRINQNLPRADVVRTLCILGSETLAWGYYGIDDNASVISMEPELRPAMFMRDDRYLELFPVRTGFQEDGCALFEFMQNLLAHLYNSVLAPEDLAVQYGFKDLNVRVARDPGVTLPSEPLPSPCGCDEYDSFC
ncbi:DUF6602 domain-containing protein [Amycolatopsis sp. NPDC098790]|uniref:DUF6602 domain-containing protein n=1 Tax=Amycolatopsis sp. NPDC098790 TaxID=3363939 RepID=UPI00381407D4